MLRVLTLYYCTLLSDWQIPRENSPPLRMRIEAGIPDRRVTDWPGRLITIRLRQYKIRDQDIDDMSQQLC
jgi:hypothetical protein